MAYLMVEKEGANIDLPIPENTESQKLANKGYFVIPELNMMII